MTTLSGSLTVVDPPTEADDWVALTEAPLPVGAAADWAVLPTCGALVLFSGTARDHASGRDGVTHLDYEAYAEQVEPRLREVVAEARRRWPEVGRMAVLHRTGVVDVGQSSVLVVASAPHRAEAFEAARFGIDAVKATVPIWKREFWPGGESWGLGATQVTEIGGSDG